MRNVRVCSRGLSALAIVAAGLGTSMGATPQGPVPDNVGGGLRHLIEGQGALAEPAAVSAAALLEPRLLRDEQSRVLVNVWLDGGRPLAAVHQSLEALGAKVLAELPSSGKGKLQWRVTYCVSSPGQK